MIKIENLQKIYKTKEKQGSVAIDNVNLTLPQKGMVFILGESGSGKTTLLNLIGGLDGFDNGEITVFENKLSTFKEKQLNSFRSSVVSFIFQDYHLLEELTVLENITLFCEEEYQKDGAINQKVLDTLKMVKIQDLQNRYPKELSGGQRQRVAIARGILKNPAVILCDEPTGNLDQNTSAQILKLLKEISKEKLVLIVSHNRLEAQKFGDRIIQLSQGKVVEDIVKDQDYCDDLKIKNNVAMLPYSRVLTQEELQDVNKQIQDRKITALEINDSGFKKTEIKYTSQKVECKQKTLDNSKVGALFKKFFFKGKANTIFTIILSVMLLGVFAVIQSFIKFNLNSALKTYIKQENSLMVIQKETDDAVLNINDDLSIFANEKTYSLYFQTIYIDDTYGDSIESGTLLPDVNNFSNLYIRENYGLLICEQDFLIKNFAIDGRLELLAGNLDGATNGNSIIITDYFADAILYYEQLNQTYRYTDYNSLIGQFKSISGAPICNIGGIIKTNYKQKYEAEFEKFEGRIKEEGDFKKLTSKYPIYAQFVNEVKTLLGVAFSFNYDYIDQYSPTVTNYLRTYGLFIKAGEKEVKYTSKFTNTSFGDIKPTDLQDNQVMLPYKLYNQLFDTSYTEKDVDNLGVIPTNTITITRYKDNDSSQKIIHQTQLTVVGLTLGKIGLNYNTFTQLVKNDWQPYRLYFDNPISIGNLMDFMVENDYLLVSQGQQKMYEINKIILSFKNLFLILKWFVLGVVAGFLILYGIKNIKQNIYQIGVLKSMGVRNAEIFKIFISKTFIIGLVCAGLSFMFSAGLILVSNYTLIGSLQSSSGFNWGGIKVIKLMPYLLGINALLTFAISLISSIIPSLKIKRLKPINIIKAKE